MDDLSKQATWGHIHDQSLEEMIRQSEFGVINKSAAAAALLKIKTVKDQQLYKSISAAGRQFTWADFCNALGSNRKTK